VHAPAGADFPTWLYPYWQFCSFRWQTALGMVLRYCARSGTLPSAHVHSKQYVMSSNGLSTPLLSESHVLADTWPLQSAAQFAIWLGHIVLPARDV
jgi:hypothetical protein